MTNAAGTASHTDWFVHDRFGLFVHWGLYSLAARHEWVKNKECIRDEVYDQYFRHFDPDLYDPAEWARLAKAAGMKYAVLTTKHHEGFCLWDSAYTDYKAPCTPAGRDLLHPFVEAFRAAGLRIGFYHSLLDWHHPHYPIDGLHPLRDDQAMRASNAQRDMGKYVEYLHGQTRELLTQFGRIDVMWFDFSYSQMDWGWSRGLGKDAWQSEKLVAMVRELQPHIILNDRLEVGGDLKTPEEYQPRARLTADGKPVLWEACQTMNGSWGYDRDNLDWRPADMLLRMLIDAVSKGGNMLLNVGPTARGEFPPLAVERLEAIARWMRLHGRSIHGCTASEWPAPPDCRYTQNGKRLYLHLFAWPFRHIHLEGLAEKVEYAQFLHDGSQVKMRVIPVTQQAQNIQMAGAAGVLTLDLPVHKPDVLVPVVELFLKD